MNIAPRQNIYEMTSTLVFRQGKDKICLKRNLVVMETDFTIFQF